MFSLYRLKYPYCIESWVSQASQNYWRKSRCELRAYPRRRLTSSILYWGYETVRLYLKLLKDIETIKKHSFVAFSSSRLYPDSHRSSSLSFPSLSLWGNLTTFLPRSTSGPLQEHQTLLWLTRTSWQEVKDADSLSHTALSPNMTMHYSKERGWAVGRKGVMDGGFLAPTVTPNTTSYSQGKH